MTCLCKSFLLCVKGAIGEVTEGLAQVCNTAAAGNNCWHSEPFSVFCVCVGGTRRKCRAGP